MTREMSSMERVLTALGHREPDRVPLLLALTLHGAKQLGLGIREYFSRAENVVEGQVRLRRRYGHDFFNPFFYASLEIEAWGGETIFREDRPPNAGAPVIRSVDQIASLEPPRVADSPRLREALRAIELLAERAKGEVPIVGVVIAPFSLPVMQMGFDRYLDLIHGDRAAFWRLMRANTAFAVEWGKAQLEAGATAICYFDPVSSPTILPVELARQTGLEVAREVFSSLGAPAVYHLASGRSLPLVDHVAAAGAAVLSAGGEEDLAEVKSACAGRLTVVGNLNGVAMRRWTAAEARETVRRAIEAAAPGGGFILSDAHGEIPWQVPDEVLEAVASAVREFGRYPIRARGAPA